MSAITNLFGQDGFFWWIGVVEDRGDPEKIGRCRVRILGYHLDNKDILPTKDLPWALPMQPITSSALSGKGSAPVGPLEGTWVIGFFADGKDKQQPIIMGTIGGFPAKSAACSTQESSNAEQAPGVVKDGSGNTVKDGSGNPVQVEAKDVGATPQVGDTAMTAAAITSDLPPLVADDIKKLMDAIGFKESSSKQGGVQNYGTTNSIGYVGKYQFGAAALVSTGYLKAPLGRPVQNSDMDLGSNWTGKNGIKNLNDWKTKGEVQEIAMFELLKYNYKILSKGTIDTAGSKGEAAGLLWVAHNQGPGAAKNFKNGINSKDAYGTGAADNYKHGKELFGENGDVKPSTAPAPSAPSAAINENPGGKKPTETLNNPAIGNPKAFSDPNSTYPTCEYQDRADTNKLATGDVAGTIVEKKNNTKINTIHTANGSPYDEPDSAYCGMYPFVHMIETESGHIIEMDDTPGKERLHIYHRSGTFVEIDGFGMMHTHVVGDNYSIMTKNNRIYTHGEVDFTVDGPAKILARDTLDIEVQGKATINIKNDANINISGNANLSVKESLKAKAKSIYLESEADFNIKAGAAMNISTGDKYSITAGGSVDIQATGYNYDGGKITGNAGASNPTAASETGLAAPADALNPTTETVEWQDHPGCDADTEKAQNADQGDDPNAQQKAVENGSMSQEDVSQSDARAAQGCKRSDSNAPKIIAPTNYKKGEFASYKEFPPTIQLSQKVTLGMLAHNCGSSSAEKNRKFWGDVSQSSFNGQTKSQIADNLRGLAVNVLDPIMARFPAVRFNSAMRLDVPPGGATKSQHLLGQACDMDFGNFSKNYEAAVWIRDNVAYDQLLLEYRFKDGKQVSWVHVSFNPSGNRPAGGAKVATMMNDKISKTILCDLSP